VSELPRGWTETNIETIAEYVQRGKSPKYTEKSDFPVVNQKCVRWSGVDTNHLKFIHPDQWNSWTSERFLRDGDILWNSTGTGTIGRAAIFKRIEEYDRLVVDSHVTIVRSSKACNSRFLHFFIQSHLVQSKIEEMQSGSTNQVELSRKQVLETAIPLPPLNEQKRIADRLDLLLTRIEKAKTHLDCIPPLLKRFRQSVLAIATSGKLTEDWREVNNLDTEIPTADAIQLDGDFLTMVQAVNYRIPDSWTWITPDAIKASEKHSLSIGPFGSNLVVKDYKDSGIPLVFVREIRARQFGDEKTKYVDEEKATELWAHRVEPGDILITKMGDPPGDVAIFPQEQSISIITADCIRLKVNPEIANTKLLLFFIESDLVRSLIHTITAGVAQQKISLKRFRTMPIPIPPLEEQHEIVRRVEALFAKADRIEAQYKTARQQVDRLTPALLAKAFRGQLVPQDPTDEPASALLERIRQQRDASPEPKKKRTPKNK
jgi:type I restriction enzyme, S subunit